MSAVFFDFDGTLCDTRGDLAATVNHARRDFGLPPLPTETVISNVGLGAKHLLSQCFGLDAPEIPERVGLGNLFERFMAHYLEHCCETVAPYPGVRETLEELARRGLRLGLNTSKPRAALDVILKRLGLAPFFGDAVIAAGDSPEMKPSAMPLVLCAEKMGRRLAPDDWMVGDNWTDVGSARNAGIRSAYCDFGFGTLRDETPTVRLGRFSDLLTAISRQKGNNP